VLAALLRPALRSGTDKFPPLLEESELRSGIAPIDGRLAFDGLVIDGRVETVDVLDGRVVAAVRVGDELVLVRLIVLRGLSDGDVVLVVRGRPPRDVERGLGAST